MNEDLLKEVLGAFGAKQVSAADLPEGAPIAEEARVCERFGKGFSPGALRRFIEEHLLDATSVEPA